MTLQCHSYKSDIKSFIYKLYVYQLCGYGKPSASFHIKSVGFIS